MRLGRRQRLSRAGTEIDDSVRAMADHQPSQMAAIGLRTGHGDKRLALVKRFLVNIKDVPVISHSL